MGLLRAGSDVDQALVRRARRSGERSLPDGVPGRVARLVAVGREQVEVLVALGEVEPRVAHVRALLGGDDVERLLGQPAAEVHRDPADERVAADLDALGGDVVDLARAPVLEVGDLRAGSLGRVQLERAGVERLARERGAEQVLAQEEVGVLPGNHERVRVLGRAGLVHQVDRLDRLLDPHALRHVYEHAARPERGGRRGKLALVGRQPLHVVLLHEVGVLLGRLLERHDDHALGGDGLVDLHEDGAGAALDDQRAGLAVERVGDHAGQLVDRLDRLVAAWFEGVEVEVAQRRRPEAGAAPVGQLLALVDRERGLAAVLEPARRHRRPRPPRG